MIAGMTFYQICWFFLIYSLIGWIIEVVYHAVTWGKAINRGFLNGPICPVYGFAGLAVFSTVNLVAGSSGYAEELSGWFIFAVGIVLSTAVELIGGWSLDMIFHARWWDYSSKPFNFHGYICLEFSIIWGMAVVFIVKVVHPTIRDYSVAAINPKYGWPLLALLYISLFIDLGVSAAIANGLNKKLKELDQMQKSLRRVSDRMSESIGERTIRTTRRIEESRVQAALARAELRDATERNRNKYWKSYTKRRREFESSMEKLRASTARQKFFGTGRLMTFPDIKHRDYQAIINRLLTKNNPEAEDGRKPVDR